MALPYAGGPKKSADVENSQIFQFFLNLLLGSVLFVAENQICFFNKTFKNTFICCNFYVICVPLSHSPAAFMRVSSYLLDPVEKKESPPRGPPQGLLCAQQGSKRRRRRRRPLAIKAARSREGEIFHKRTYLCPPSSSS